jgi:hypothetical protein
VKDGGQMQGGIVRAVILAAFVSVGFAAVALSAPVPGTAPSISGKPNFDSRVTCNPGTWSGGAVSFSYVWTYNGGGPTIATTQKLHAPRTVTDFNILCVVTATDAQGQTASASSPGVVIGAGISTLKITSAKVKQTLVTVSGVGGPGPALERGPAGGPYVVLDRVLSKNHFLQLAGPQIVTSRKGKFTISAHDSRGRHTYLLLFVPPASTGFAETSADRKLNVR